MVVLNQLMNLAESNSAHIQTKAISLLTLQNLLLDIESSVKTEKDMNEKAFLSYMSQRISLFFKDPSDWQTEDTLPLPDGSPIGSNLNCGMDD
jgi:hypothetical protein